MRLGRWVALVLLALTLGGTALVQVLPPPRPTPTAPSSRAGHSADGGLGWYFQSGQWRADARTLAAMVRYLVSPEPATGTNRAAMPA